MHVAFTSSTDVLGSAGMVAHCAATPRSIRHIILLELKTNIAVGTFIAVPLSNFMYPLLCYRFGVVFADVHVVCSSIATLNYKSKSLNSKSQTQRRFITYVLRVCSFIVCLGFRLRATAVQCCICCSCRLQQREYLKFCGHLLLWSQVDNIV